MTGQFCYILEDELAELRRINANQHAALAILADRWNWHWNNGTWKWSPQDGIPLNPLEIATLAFNEGTS